MYGLNGIFIAERLLRRKMFVVTNMSDLTKASTRGCDNGSLTDGFGVLIQGLLAVVAFSTLMCTLHFLLGDSLPISQHDLTFNCNVAMCLNTRLYIVA